MPGANSTATPSENAQALAQMQTLRDGAVDAKNQAEAARDDAAHSAELAQQAANNNGFAALEIDPDGNLQLTRTENLANKLDFAIVDIVLLQCLNRLWEARFLLH